MPLSKPTGVLEIKVLSLLLHRRTYLKYKTILNAEFFKSAQSKTIYKVIVKLHEKLKKKRIWVKDTWMVLERYIDEDEYGLYKRLLQKIRFSAKRKEDEDVIHYSITRFAQESLLKQTLSSRLGELEEGIDVDLSDLKYKIDSIVSLNGNKRIPDYEYFAHHNDRVDLSKEPVRIPTGISKELDYALNGGLAQGELGFFLAPPGRGKTLALVNIGANALLHGKKVLHLTLEIKARKVGIRYDCCLTQSTFNELLDAPSVLQKKLDKIKKAGGELIIRDYSYSHCGIGELNSIMEESVDSGKMFDVLIVDYADLMVPPQHYKDTRHETSKIYEELRIIAGQFSIPVWTASQGNRISLGKKSMNMQDIAESIGKANIADLIIALDQTEEEKMEKEMRLAVIKSRMGSTNPNVRVVSDLDRMVLRDMREGDEEVHWDRPRIHLHGSNVRNHKGKKVQANKTLRTVRRRKKLGRKSRRNSRKGISVDS